MLIFDEAQFPFPTRFGRRGEPPRLNYVRRAIMDLGLPTAFVYTPQSWKRVEKNYLKATGYTIEQFEGRLLRSAVVLPDELSSQRDDRGCQNPLPRALGTTSRIHCPAVEGNSRKRHEQHRLALVENLRKGIGTSHAESCRHQASSAGRAPWI